MTDGTTMVLEICCMLFALPHENRKTHFELYSGERSVSSSAPDPDVNAGWRQLPIGCVKAIESVLQLKFMFATIHSLGTVNRNCGDDSYIIEDSHSDVEKIWREDIIADDDADGKSVEVK